MQEDGPANGIPASLLAPRIVEVRGRRVLLGSDLASLYGVTPKRLNEQVRRNPGRFPEEFCIRMTHGEVRELAANCGQFRNLLHSSKLPLAFTEYGALMAATVLRSPRAEEMSVLIVRAFVQIRAIVSRGRHPDGRVSDLERTVAEHGASLRGIGEAIGELLERPEEADRPRIGFRPRGGAADG
jgi:hypothetical protein